MTVKLIALDLDGTTLNNKNEITPRTLKAFKAAMDKGIHVVVSTGRCFHSLPTALEHAPGLEYAVTSNGAEIRELQEGECTYRNCINSETILDIYKLLSGFDLMVEVFTDGRAYIGEKEYGEILEGKHTHRTVRYIVETRNKVPDVLEFMLKHKDAIENINVFFGTHEEKAAMLPILGQIENITLTSSLLSNYEIGGKTTSKASALKELATRLNIGHDEIMAVGDSPNDIEMLNLAKVSVAVANARDNVKAVAEYITDTNDEDGVAKAIEKYAL